MRLQRTDIKNFKGVTDFTLQVNGENKTDIFGDNATGKTTIVDSQMWLLFDKDSAYKKTFQIKPLDADENEIHHLETSVESAYAMADGSTLNLKKVFAEKYTKKRGTAVEEMTGHTTKYWIDGEKVQKKDFIAKVAECADEELFKLLTNPLYFNEHLHWKDRRDMIQAVCGTVTDEEVIAANTELAELAAVLDGKTADSRRNILMERRRQINEELSSIPSKIEGANSVLPERINTRLDVLIERITGLQEELSGKQRELATVEAGGQKAQFNQRTAEINTAVESVKSKHQQLAHDTTKGKMDKWSRLCDSIQDNGNLIKDIKAELDEHKRVLDNLRKENSDLVARYKQINSSVFTGDTVCPTCQQDLPEDSVGKAKAAFNTKRAGDLDAVKTAGNKNKESITILEEQIGQLEQSLIPLREKNVGWEKEKSALQAEIDNLNSSVPDISEVPEYKELMKERDQIAEQVARLEQGQKETVDGINAALSDIQEKIKADQEIISTIETRQKGEQAIADMQARQKELAVQFEVTEKHLNLIDLFTRQKVSMMDEAINSHFEMARFKLFEEQINGGLNPVCVATYQGVPFPSLNHAAKVQVGMDIIKTLSRHHDFYPMIFVDGCESVTKLPEMEAQVIAIYVSEADKELRVQ